MMGWHVEEGVERIWVRGEELREREENGRGLRWRREAGNEVKPVI